MTTNCCFLAILVISIYLGTFGFDNLSFVISQLSVGLTWMQQVSPR